MRLRIDDRRSELGFEAREYLAVEAPPVLLGAFLEPGMKLFRNVLERQVEHRGLGGTIMEPF